MTGHHNPYPKPDPSHDPSHDPGHNVSDDLSHDPVAEPSIHNNAGAGGSLHGAAEMSRVEAGPPVLLAVTWLMTLQVWWSYFWRTSVYVLLASLFFGFLWGLVAGLLGESEPDPMIFNVMGVVLTVCISFLVLRDILEKKFRRFTVALVERPPA